MSDVFYHILSVLLFVLNVVLVALVILDRPKRKAKPTTAYICAGCTHPWSFHKDKNGCWKTVGILGNTCQCVRYDGITPTTGIDD